MIIPMIAAVVMGSGVAFVAVRNLVTKTKSKRMRPIEKFLAALKNGSTPTEGQYQAALLSCLVTHRLDTARRIAEHHGDIPVLATTLLQWGIDNGRVDIVDLIFQAFPEVANLQDSKDDTQYHPTLPAPDSDEWLGFLKRFQRESPHYESIDHVGAYEHHKRRVAVFCPLELIRGNLGLQGDVLTKDLHRLYSEYPDLALHAKREITLPDESSQVVTPSGILALLKCAGPRGAMNWLENPAERSQFPTTTSLFTECNGIF